MHRFDEHPFTAFGLGLQHHANAQDYAHMMFAGYFAEATRLWPPRFSPGPEAAFMAVPCTCKAPMTSACTPSRLPAQHLSGRSTTSVDDWPVARSPCDHNGRRQFTKRGDTQRPIEGVYRTVAGSSLVRRAYHLCVICLCSTHIRFSGGDIMPYHFERSLS